MAKKISNFTIFRSLFVINLFTFGGGYTIIPIIKDEFVKQRGLIEEEDMNKILTVSQSLPGVMTISASFLTGWYVNGILGAISAILAAILPCFIVIAAIYLTYTKIIGNMLVQNALSGISGAISALLLLTVISMFKKSVMSNKRYFYLAIIVASFVARYAFNLNIVYIVIVSGFLGYMYNRGDENA